MGVCFSVRANATKDPKGQPSGWITTYSLYCGHTFIPPLSTQGHTRPLAPTSSSAWSPMKQVILCTV